MHSSFHLDAYLDRIRWGGAVRHDRDTLAGLLLAHMRAIPFENIDVLLRRPIRLDLEGVQAKLVAQRRGGYCFEHGTLLAAALEALGFEPVRHTARVVMVLPLDEAPRTHMFLSVGVPEGRFILDPGFGSIAPRVPVPLVDGEKVSIGTESHWMVREGDRWRLRAHVGGKTSDAWVSTMEQENLVDFVMGNHYTSTFPASAFVNRLTLRALTDDGRVTVMNRDVTVWHGDTPIKTQLEDRAALRALLATHFGFDLPEVEQLQVPSIEEWR